MSCGETLGANLEEDIVLMFLDISRAHPHCPIHREVCTELPTEHPAAKDKTRCGLLMMTLYGCRDAGSNFELFVFEILSEAGCVRGLTSSCVYFQKNRGVRLFHWGDDFVLLGKRSQCSWISDQLGKKLIVKTRGTLGPRKGDLREISILHEHLPGSPGGEKITYCADPRHGEALRIQCGMDAPLRSLR